MGLEKYNESLFFDEKLNLNTPKGLLNLETLQIDPSLCNNENTQRTNGYYIPDQEYQEPIEYLNLLRELLNTDSVRSQSSQRKLSLITGRDLVSYSQFQDYTNFYSLQILGYRYVSPLFVVIDTHKTFVQDDINIKKFLLGTYTASIPKPEILKLKNKRYTHKNNIVNNRNKKMLVSELLNIDDIIDYNTHEDLQDRIIHDYQKSEDLDFNSSLIVVSDCETKINKLYSENITIDFDFTFDPDERLEYTLNTTGIKILDNHREYDAKLFNSFEYQNRIFNYYLRLAQKNLLAIKSGNDIKINSFINIDPILKFWEVCIDHNPNNNLVDLSFLNMKNKSNYLLDTSDFIETESIYRDYFLPFLSLINYDRFVDKNEFSSVFSLITKNTINRNNIKYYKSNNNKPSGYSGIKLKPIDLLQ